MGLTIDHNSQEDPDMELEQIIEALEAAEHAEHATDANHYGSMLTEALAGVSV